MVYWHWKALNTCQRPAEINLSNKLSLEKAVRAKVGEGSKVLLLVSRVCKRTASKVPGIWVQRRTSQWEPLHPVPLPLYTP